MESNPFSLGSPERLAKFFGGDKQRILQALQNGALRRFAPAPMDQTLALAAANFIDDTNAAAATTSAPQQTLFEQKFAPQQAPMGAPAGLGATPQAAAMPMMGMPAPAPAPAPEAAPPVGMSMGGLTSLPVPDDMFDEPNNGSYANGGLVAFSGGGTAGGWGSHIEDTLYKLDPNIEISGRARTPARNAEVGGVANSYHMIDAARDVRVPKGMDKPTFIAQLKSVFGSDYDILPSKGNSVHVEPGPELGKKVRAGAAPSNAPAQAPERDTATAEGRFMSIEDAMGFGGRMLSDLPREELERAKASARETLDPANQKKELDYDNAMALAKFGFNVATMPSIAEAALATIPEMEASKKERKAAKNAAVRDLMAYEDIDRKTAMARAELGMDVLKSTMTMDQAEKNLALQKEQIQSSERIAVLNRAAQLEAARISAEGKTTDFETYANAIYAGLRKSNAQGLLEKDGKKYSFADEALRAMAVRKAAEALGRGKEAAQSIEGVVGLGGGSAGAQPEVVNLGGIE